MVVVSYLYNSNGMATWCLEASRALFQSGIDVLMVHSGQQSLPTLPYNTIVFTDSHRKLSMLKNITERLSGNPSNFLPNLDTFLKEHHIQPTLYLLNQSNLCHPSIRTPQFVVGWSYPPSLAGYLAKTLRQGQLTLDKKSVFTLMDAIGWYNKDTTAYRNAQAVLAVSNRLAGELKKRGHTAYAVYPPLSVESPAAIHTWTVRKKIILASLDLENPQKRIKWVIEALKKVDYRLFEVLLIGDGSQSFKDWVKADGFPATFLGLLAREEAMVQMESNDIFIFGSSFDDWGFVQVEAMRAGLIVLAPNITPCDEISAAPELLLFDGDSQKDLIAKLTNLLSMGDLTALKKKTREKLEQDFHPSVFAQGILRIAQENGVSLPSNSTT